VRSSQSATVVVTRDTVHWPMFEPTFCCVSQQGQDAI